MYRELWNAFAETGEPMCFLICRADEKSRSEPEIKPIPEEFRMNPPVRPEPGSPRMGA